MKNPKRKVLSILTALVGLIGFPLGAQEFLNSPLYDYFRILEIDGTMERANLNYHSLSTNLWPVPANPDHPWDWITETLSEETEGTLKWKIFPLEAVFSHNGRYARGFNDGAAWQGKGLNGRLRGGLLAEYRGFSATFAPLLWYAQNLAFPLVPADPSHGSPYAYFTPSIDLPQRFGNRPLAEFDWGESEIRYSRESFTVGFGTQSVWLGPSTRNAIILSDNAGGFPKFDIGLLKTETAAGSWEGRFFLGFLSESSYVAPDIRDKNRYLTGYSLSYAPFFIPGLTMGFHRTALFYNANWNMSEVLGVLLPMGTSMGKDEMDQRASLTFEWTYPKMGFSVYAEWARNDYSSTIRYILSEPEHSQAYTLGIKQILINKPESKLILNFELSHLLHTMDYQTDANIGRGTAGFYTHHIVRHGHTQNGQLLGAAAGPGGDSQYFGLSLYESLGKLSLYVHRRAINSDYLYGQPDEIRRFSSDRKNSETAFGLSGLYWISSKFGVSLDFAVLWNINNNFIADTDIWSYAVQAGFQLYL
jgi:hypothetical protein